MDRRKTISRKVNTENFERRTIEKLKITIHKKENRNIYTIIKSLLIFKINRLLFNLIRGNNRIKYK